MMVREEIIQSIALKLLSQKEHGSFLHAKFKRLVSEKATQAFEADIEHVDTGYDQSCFGRKTSISLDKTKFKTINDFLEYPTGDSRPTFCSGSGMCAETWEDRIIDDWREIVVNQYNGISEYQSVLSDGRWTDWKGSLITDKDEIIEDLDQELTDHIIDTELMGAWRHDSFL
jgi:hypothetical protein